MLQPPPMPPAVLTIGKITVGLSWLFGLYGWLLADPATLVHTIGFWLTIVLAGSHAVEILIYRAFLQAAKASPADYVQVLLFGVFHSSGMKVAG